MNAIVYTSETGSTKRYAMMLGEELGLEVYNAQEAPYVLSQDTHIIYMGWICASKIKGLNRFINQYDVLMIIGVGMGPSGSQLDILKKKNKINTPLYTLQGNLNRDELHGLNRIMMSIAIKGLSQKKELNKEDKEMLEVMEHKRDFVQRENLQDIIHDYKKRYTLCNK